MARIVIALGGNALLKRGETPDIATQRANARTAAEAVAPLAAGHELIVTHGNGPQIGLLAMQAAQQAEGSATPLDMLGAETEGLIGYLLEQEFRNALPARKWATVLTMIEVDPEDPAMAKPTKPIGPIYDAETWKALAELHGWDGVTDGGGMRRAVPSPQPKAVLQLAEISDRLAAGILPICAGGGGIPVARDAEKRLYGIEAVIDKDWSSALLAAALDADEWMMLTDVDAIYSDWNTPQQAPIAELTPEQAGTLSLPAGSMGPKAAAGAWFAARTGTTARIGALEAAAEILAGRSGTAICQASSTP